jgi:hypothetical protein
MTPQSSPSLPPAPLWADGRAKPGGVHSSCSSRASVTSARLFGPKGRAEPRPPSRPDPSDRSRRIASECSRRQRPAPMPQCTRLRPVRFISSDWAIHLSGPDEKRPLDAVVMAARHTKILRLVRLTEYPRLLISRTGRGASVRTLTRRLSPTAPTSLGARTRRASCQPPATDRRPDRVRERTAEVVGFSATSTPAREPAGPGRRPGPAPHTAGRR